MSAQETGNGYCFGGLNPLQKVSISGCDHLNQLNMVDQNTQLVGNQHHIRNHQPDPISTMPMSPR